MAKQFAVLISLFAVFTSLLPLVSSTPVPNWEVDILRTWGMDVLPEWPTVELPFTGRRTFIGYRGFTGEPKAPYASGGGELGAVYYVADAIDLARFFMRGPDHTKDHLCRITVDADAWDLIPKVWVPPATIALGSNAMNSQYPGAVLFAPHAHPQNPGCPPNVYQLGIREAQIARLKIDQDCHPPADYSAANHDTLDYNARRADWHIQFLLSFSGMDVWLKAGTLPME